MPDRREISGNTIGNNAIIVQGDFNTTDAGSFLNKISKTDPYYDKKRILETKGPFLHKSFSWILDHEGFKKWRHTKASGVLWIKGDPGKGKTMLLCGIVEDLEKNPGINANLGYFFCQATDSRINTATSVVAGLIFSLVNKEAHDEHRAAAIKTLREKFSDKFNQLEGPNAWSVLCDIFKTVTQDKAMLDPVCIVDALDECQHNCKPLLKFIVDTSTHVKWLLSSRNVKEIERELRKIESNRILSLELKANAENISKSVDAYINNSIQDIEALEDDIELQMHTTETLKHKANGTFLWVALVIEQLRDTDRRNVEDVLNEIPAGLENLYKLIMDRAYSKLRPKDQEACRVLLSIITTAERPLHLKELYLFISSQWAGYKATYDIRDVRDILKDLSSLLYTRDDTVYFIHQSVKDYIVDYATTSTFPLGIEYQHYQMARTSLDAMCQNLKYDICDLKRPGSELQEDLPQIPDQLRSIAYCCVYWVDHLVRGCNSEGPTPEDLSKDDGVLHSFLITKFLCWLESLALLRSLEPRGVRAIEKLRNWADGSCGKKSGDYHLIGLKGDTNCLGRFISDASDFFHFCNDYVKEWPLQLYYSAIFFENQSSAIYKTFRQPVQAHFGNGLTFLKKPRKHFSLRHEISTEYHVKKLIYSWDSSALCVLFSRSIVVYRTDTMKQTFDWSIDDMDHHVAFFPDSKHLIAVSSSGIVQTWTIENRAQLQQRSLNLNVSELQNRDHSSKNVPQEEVISLSSHGDLAVSTCLTESSHNVSLVKIWTTETCACACQIDLMQTSTTPENLYAIFAPNSSLIALTHRDDARVYSAQTGEEMKHIQGPNTECSAYIESVGFKKCSKFSQDSELLALVHEKSFLDADIHLWCSKTWTRIRWIKLNTSIKDIDLSPNASLFVLVSGADLIVGSTGTGKHLFNIATGSSTTTISFSPDWPNSSRLASADRYQVRIWEVDASDTSTELHNTAYPPSSVTISPRSKYVAAQSLGGYINIWSGDSGESVQVLKGGDPRDGRLLFSPNSGLIACEDEDENDVRIWRVDTGESIRKFQGPNQPRVSLYRLCKVKVFSDDSRYLCIAHTNWGVKVWCVDSGKCLFETDGSTIKYTPLLNNSYRLVRLAISRDSKYLAIACDGNMKEPWEVRIWDWRVGHRVSTFSRSEGDYQGPYGGWPIIKSVAFSSDAAALAVVYGINAYQYEVQIWEVATGIRLARVAAGESYCVPLFNPLTNQILTDRAIFCKTSSWDCWDEIPQLPRRRYSISWDSGRPWLCCNGEKVFCIPGTPQLKFAKMRSEAMSDSLLAYATPSGDVVIIRLPGF